MNDLLEEIKMLKGVQGAFVYTEKFGLVASDMPASAGFSLAAMERLGVFVKRFFSNPTTMELGVMSYEVRNPESLILLKKIDNQATLITVCDTTVSMPLVNMTTSMLIAELKSAVDLITEKPDVSKLQPQAKPAQTAAAQAKKPASQVPPKPQTKVVDVDKLLKEGPFAAIARKLEDSMARAIGPVGSMVVRDCVEKWVATGSPSKDRFGELMALLLKEIGDSRLEEEFKQEVGSLLS
ncbi:MAG: hypothetical protein C0613_07335 [Desulfobulbaceae bacterium]|nr:MAG: hypothetical protein C0613_07335 [Desulfobulbaceae bacterium]